jgi:hypothetical protein
MLRSGDAAPHASNDQSTKVPALALSGTSFLSLASEFEWVMFRKYRIDPWH